VSHRRSASRSILLGRILAAAGLTVATVAVAQQASPVRFTEVQNHEIRRSIRLPGSVEARTASVVATEVAGYVVAVDVQEGDRVRKGHALARLRTIWFELQLQEADGRLKEARARLELAESKLRRARELFADEVISQDELDDAFSENTAWQGRVDQTTAEIARLKFALDRCTIRAPFDGAVVAKRMDLGQWIEQGGPVFEMVELGSLEVRVEVPERLFTQLRSGAEAEVAIESLADLKVTGRIDGIIPRADPRARSFPIKVRITNPEGRIGVGMLAQVSLAAGEIYSAVVVPKDAVVRQGNQEVVFRIDGNETVEPVPVSSGQALGEWVVVDGPLSSGDRVVTRGNERLFPGQPVKGEELEYPLP
jgi:RND family efflux transporter MFP subunit